LSSTKKIRRFYGFRISRKLEAQTDRQTDERGATQCGPFGKAAQRCRISSISLVYYMAICRHVCLAYCDICGEISEIVLYVCYERFKSLNVLKRFTNNVAIRYDTIR